MTQHICVDIDEDRSARDPQLSRAGHATTLERLSFVHFRDRRAVERARTVIVKRGNTARVLKSSTQNPADVLAEHGFSA